MSLRWIAIVLGLLSMFGCAKPPHQELDAADYMVARARALQAPQYAPTEFQAAYEALQDAKTFMQANDFGSAEDSLEFALQHARRAITLTEEAKATIAAEEAARRKAEEQARMAAEKARQAEEARRAQSKTKQAKPKSAEKTTPPQPVATYEVGEGETLWTIADQPVVYGDGFLWPLLYQANRDQIKDPRQIYPGQILNIRRDLTEQEMEEARQKARESDIFPLPER